jgi:hypothetical protein
MAVHAAGVPAVRQHLFVHWPSRVHAEPVDWAA